MKKLTKTILIFIVLLNNISIFAQSYTDTLLNKQIIKIPFSDFVGDSSLLVIINSHHQFANWYLFFDYWVVKIEPPNSLLTVAEASLSHKQKYLSVVSVGEGHPQLEVFLFSELIDINKENDKELSAKLFINPYPGYIGIVKWTDQDNIIVATERMLTYNTEKYNNHPIGFIDEQKYSINISTKKVTALTKNAQNPVKYFMKQLDNEDIYHVADAIIALTKLKVMTAIPKLKELAKNHEEEYIREDAQKANEILNEKKK